jgi:hypothetical protein
MLSAMLVLAVCIPLAFWGMSIENKRRQRENEAYWLALEKEHSRMIGELKETLREREVPVYVILERERRQNGWQNEGEGSAGEGGNQGNVLLERLDNS